MCRHLLWVDGSAGAVVGTTVLLLAGWLSTWYGLPRELLLLTGGANLAYASYSFSLAVRRRRSRLALGALVAANLAWAVLCLRWVIVYADSAGALGLLHLGAEGLFVGALGLQEWRCRDALVHAKRSG